jgi:hypothetical protein
MATKIEWNVDGKFTTFNGLIRECVKLMVERPKGCGKQKIVDCRASRLRVLLEGSKPRSFDFRKVEPRLQRAALRPGEVERSAPLGTM